MTAPKQVLITGLLIKERLCVPTKLDDIVDAPIEVIRVVMGRGEIRFVKKDGSTFSWEALSKKSDEIQFTHESLKNIKVLIAINKIGTFYLQEGKPYLKDEDKINEILGENQYSALYAKFDLAAFVKEDNKLQLYPGDHEEIKLTGTPKYITFNDNWHMGVLIGTTLTIYSVTENSIKALYSTEDVVAFDAGVFMFIVLKVDGTVWQYSPHNTKLQITGITGLPISVFAGYCHYGVVTLDGDCYTWGWGFSGQLGCGSFTISETPTKVIIEDRLKVVEAAADVETTAIIVVPAVEFAPVIPAEMLNNEFVKTSRIESYSVAGYKPVSEDETF